MLHDWKPLCDLGLCVLHFADLSVLAVVDVLYRVSYQQRQEGQKVFEHIFSSLHVNVMHGRRLK